MTTKSKKVIDKNPIKELSKLLDEFNLTEVSYKEGDFAVSVSRVTNISNTQTSSVPPTTESQSSAAKDFSNDPRAFKSPMVGTVYLQPEPGANKFVNEGDKIKSGQILLVIEAMKTMNPIESTLQGKLIKVLIENEQAVEFGQPLMLIE
jgi:acetyl-CoA carboxylase biotin carboxyl carrier protein